MNILSSLMFIFPFKYWRLFQANVEQEEKSDHFTVYECIPGKFLCAIKTGRQTVLCK